MRAASALLAFFAAAVAAWRWSPVRRYAVEGPSMEPAFADGDRVLVNRLAYVRQAPCIGDVVVLRDPEQPARHLIKRIVLAPDLAKDPAPASFYVLGDNGPMSRDSRHFGAVPRRAIIGRVWRRY